MRTVATALPVAHQELATGWPVIVACTAAAIFAWGFGAFGPAVYFAELKERYGWPAATIGGATTLAFITGALLLPFVGAAIERFGQRRVLTSAARTRVDAPIADLRQPRPDRLT